MRTLCNALSYMHAKKVARGNLPLTPTPTPHPTPHPNHHPNQVVHRDPKPENIPSRTCTPTPTPTPHPNQVVHRDLKPENILYSDPSESAAIRVADFGLARF